MKFRTNYELLSKIGEAKTGFNVNRVGNKFSFLTVVTGIVLLAVPAEELGRLAGFAIFNNSYHSFGNELLSLKTNKQEAQEELSKLASQLRSLDVSTNSTLLLDSQAYKTEYKVKLNEKKIPSFVQNKYIIVPTNKEGEVSLLQEHVVGSRHYSLSVGEPSKQKQYKLAYNGA